MLTTTPWISSLLHRGEIGVSRIFGLEINAPLFLDEPLKRAFAVDQGGDDIVGLRLLFFQNDDIAGKNAGVDHAVAPHPDGEGPAGI